jgi:multidrug resistance efflux pump
VKKAIEELDTIGISDTTHRTQMTRRKQHAPQRMKCKFLYLIIVIIYAILYFYYKVSSLYFLSSTQDVFFIHK